MGFSFRVQKPYHSAEQRSRKLWHWESSVKQGPFLFFFFFPLSLSLNLSCALLHLFWNTKDNLIIKIYQEFSQGIRRGCEIDPLLDQRLLVGLYWFLTSSGKHIHKVTLTNPDGIQMAQELCHHLLLSSFFFLSSKCPFEISKCISQEVVGRESRQVQLTCLWQ